MKHFLFGIVFFYTTIFTVFAQENDYIVKDQKPFMTESPRLVVGIVIDQMRYDYLTRFYKRFGNDGFKRLMDNGFQCANNHFNYIPTYTGPGHASVFTGTTPQNHGIISNYWYNKFDKKQAYCASDPSVTVIGSKSEAEKMSPHRMKTTTFADQNRLHTQMRGKSVGVAIKDRGAILPAGHAANAAYWFRGKDEGKWITTSYYMDKLPKWVESFNDSDKVNSYLKTWKPLYDINTYTESGPDNNTFERGFSGKSTPVFPYDLTKLKDENGGFDIVKATPFGNSLTADFAIAALKGEELGTDEITDVLTVSFSSTDYVGHNFGVNSKEIEDTYLRLDKDLARFLNELDNHVGRDKYTVFLTADHGAVHVPAYLQSKKIPAGYFSLDTLKTAILNFTKQKFGIDGLIEEVDNDQVFFNYERISESNIETSAIEHGIAQFLLKKDKVNKVFTRTQLESTEYVSGIAALIQKGYHQKRSGDVIFVMDPATIAYPSKGSTHGSGLSYDTHVPLLFFGKGIKKGKTYKKTHITDIAPTISAMLGIAFPNGATGEVLSYVFEIK